MPRASFLDTKMTHDGSHVRRQQVNRASSQVLIALTLIALLAVFIGYIWPPPPDEGAAAHIFQLSLALLVPAMLLFLGTADWKQPLRSALRLVFPAFTLIVAFAALYYLEHYR